jgi:abnormal spindle-like microcephaly-associated protein
MKVKAQISIPEDWAEKQCNAFTEWLNYMFKPTEDMEHELIVKQIENGQGSYHQMNRAALRTLVVHQRLAQARARGFQVFHTPDMKKARNAIVAEIARGRLSLRTDRDLHADLNLRGKVVSLLLSYSTQWLRIGLEVLLGEPIFAETPKLPSSQMNKALKNKTPTMSRMQLTLKNVIVSRLLADSATLRKFTKGRCNIPSGRFEKQYQEEMRTFVLTRLLVLIVFLDKAKMACILDRVPRLFVREAKVKSTKDVLASLCRDFLSSEGDVTKHLSRIGVTVAYKQEPIDELEFGVENLAADIRDGVRLARMTEIIANVPTKSLLATLRLPAVSRLQKLHNVGVVLDVLTQRGIPNLNDVASHHIVDGYREQVLQLLWNVIAHLGLAAVLQPADVENEIMKVETSNRTRSVSWNLRNEIRHRPAIEVLADDDGRGIQSLLLHWCNVVVAPFGVYVSDYTASFADGVAICLLIHYYHPSLLRLVEIKPTSRHGLIITDALANERLNLELAAERMSELGGIPKLLPIGDTRNAPEGKSMFLCLVYLCSRLMQSSTEVLACMSIQFWYRRKKKIELLARKIAASKVIWKVWEDRKSAYFCAQSLKYCWCVRVIESFAVAKKHRLRELRNKRERFEEQTRCFTTFQAHVRSWQTRQRVEPLLRRNSSARLIQRNWRLFSLRQALATLKKRRIAATVVQAAWRGFTAYTSFSEALWGFTLLQAHLRGAVDRIIHRRKVAAAIEIQRIFRGFLSQVSFHVDMLDIVTIQSLVRRYLAIRLRNRKEKAISVSQSFIRMQLSMRVLERMKIERMIEQSRHDAAVMLQSAIRGYACRLEMKLSRCQIRACVEIQRTVRGWITRILMNEKTAACVLLQSQVRGFTTRITMTRLKSSALLIQTSWRLYAEKFRFRQTVLSIIKVQSFLRRLFVRLRLRLAESCAVNIQKTWRQYRERGRLEEAISSAVKIQSCARAMFAIRSLSRLLSCVITVQKYARKWKAQRVVVLARMTRSAMDMEANECNAAIRIQSLARVLRSVALVHSMRVDLQTKTTQMLWASVFTQAFVRICLASVIIQSQRRVRLLRLETQAAVVIQCNVRRYNALQERRRLGDIRDHAATQIQSHWRQVTAKNALRSSRTAAVVIQGAIRGALVRSDIRIQASYARIVQSTWRMLHMKMKYRRKVQCILLVQTVIRRQSALRLSKSRRKAVAAIQSFGRIVLAKNILKQKSMQRAACQMQKIARGSLARAELNRLASSTLRIQTIWRMFQVKSTYRLTIRKVILAQSTTRRLLAKKSTHLRHASLLTLQGFGRVILAKCTLSVLKAKQRAFVVRTASSTGIQAVYRGWKARKVLEQQITAATIIQREWMCFTAFLQYQSDLMDIIIVQSIVRRRQARALATKKCAAILTVQVAARRWLALTRAKARFAKMVARMRFRSAAAIKLQAAFRCYMARALLRKHKAATKIQKTWRCFTGHVDYLLAILDVMTIQRCARQYILKCRTARAVPGITAMQSLYRAHIQERSYQQRRRALIKVQACSRGHLVRRALYHDHIAATTIQRFARGFLDRIDIEIRNFAAADIQRVWRGFLGRVDTLFRLVMILRVQTTARRFLASRMVGQIRRVAEVDRRHRTHSVRIIQRCFRRYVVSVNLSRAACKIQKAMRAFCAKMRFEKLNASVVLIQGLFRGKHVRQRRTRKVREVAVRIANAKERARQNPDLVLGVRTQRALWELRTSKRLTEIMEAAKILETSTRLSINCCVAFVDVGAPNILYDLIGTCNRSLPHIEILYYVLLILQNVSRHKHLLEHVASSKATELFLDLVQMLRDKQDLFIIAVTLLSRVARANDDCKQICSKSESMKRLNHVLKKVSVSVQTRHDLTRMNRVRGVKRGGDPVRVLRSLLFYLKD